MGSDRIERPGAWIKLRALSAPKFREYTVSHTHQRFTVVPSITMHWRPATRCTEDRRWDALKAVDKMWMITLSFAHWLHLSLQSIPQTGEKVVKTFRWDHVFFKDEYYKHDDWYFIFYVSDLCLHLYLPQLTATTKQPQQMPLFTRHFRPILSFFLRGGCGNRLLARSRHDLSSGYVYIIFSLGCFIFLFSVSIVFYWCINLERVKYVWEHHHDSVALASRTLSLFFFHGALRRCGVSSYYLVGDRHQVCKMDV